MSEPVSHGIPIKTILYSLGLYLSLAIGGIGLGEEFSFARLATSGPLFIAAIFLLPFVKKISASNIAIALLIIMYCLLQTMRSDELGLALQKLDGFIFGSFLVFLFGHIAVNRGESQFYHAFIISAIFILILTIFYKLIFGLWDREVRFFINGPITFGWMMAISSLVAIFCAQRFGRVVFYLYAFPFVSALLWTGSKGPLIGVFAGISYLLYSSGRLTKLPLFLVGTLFTAIFLYEYNLLPDRFGAFERLLTGDQADMDFGSIGIRQIMFEQSWHLFKENYFIGVGLGNWAINTNLNNYYSGIAYPHNIISEILSEHGIMGCIIIFSLCTYVFISASVLGRAIFTTIFTSLLFTGDMAYWHLLIALPLAISTSNRKGSAR